MVTKALIPDDSKEYWIQEGLKDAYLNRWVVDLVYSDEHGEWPSSSNNELDPIKPGASSPAPLIVSPDTSGPLPSADTSPVISANEGGVISTCGSTSSGPDAQDDIYRYAVYLDEDLSIQWYFRDCTPNRTLNDDHFFPQGWGKILTDVVHLQTMSEGLRSSLWENKRIRPSEDGSTDFRALRNEHPTLRNARLLIAEGLARMFAKKTLKDDSPIKDEEDIRYTTASAALAKAREYITARSNEEGRKRVLLSAFTTLFGGLFVLLLLVHLYNPTGTNPPPYVTQLFRTLFRSEQWLTPENWAIIHISFLGGLGAFLSTLHTSKGQQYDAGSSRWSYRLEGACRIFAGILGALLLLLAIKAKVFVFPVGTTDTSDGWQLAFVAILAGLSERFVPTFVTAVEAQLQSGGKNTPPTT